MQSLRLILLILSLGIFMCSPANAAEYKLKDGTVVKGEPVSPSDKGVIIKGEDGKFSSRYTWDQFSQEALKEFVKDPKASKFASLLVEVAPEDLNLPELQVAERPKAAPIELKSKPSPGRPHKDIGFMAAMTTGFGGMLAWVLYFANIYAALEIAHFRNWPKWIPTLAAAIAPFVAPIVFLAMPTRHPKSDEAEVAMEEEPAIETTYQEQVNAQREAAEEAAEAAKPVIPPTVTFRRGESNLNRRFIETKCASFFKVIPSDAERDMRLHIKSARGEVEATRISRVTNTELVVQIIKEGASADEPIQLNDIFEIKIRHKDAQD